MPEAENFDKDLVALKRHFETIEKKYKIAPAAIMQYFSAISIRDAVSEALTDKKENAPQG